MDAVNLGPPTDKTFTGTTFCALSLRSEGYDVQLDGGPSQGSLSQCTATGVSGLRGSNIDDEDRRIDKAQLDTVYVTTSCNDTV